MFNLGFSELILLGVIALIFIGPNQLPELARSLGRLLNELKRASSDFQASLTDDVKGDLHQRWQQTREEQGSTEIVEGEAKGEKPSADEERKS